MKIAVTAETGKLESKVDPRFGRASVFLIYDTESKDVTTLENTQNLNAVQGAGIQAASVIAKQGVKVLITGNCGPKAFKTLQASGVDVYIGAEGRAGEMIEKYLAGELKKAETPNVEGHW